MYPPYVPAHPWPDILERFEQLAVANPRFAPMFSLVRQLVSSRYVSGLYGVKSMHTLVLGQTPEIDWERENLRIELTLDGRSIRMTMVEDPRAKQGWTKQVPAEEGFSALEHFLLHTKKWFVLK